MSDTAEYSAVATNQHGTATSKATVTVKSKSFSHSVSLHFQTLFYTVSMFFFVNMISFSSQDQQEPESPAILV